MKAEIINLTPQKAEELLKMNIGNRRLKPIVNVYVAQMKKGEWKENGEPIIVDVNGFVKDGQHRLHAVIAAGFSYNVPLITDINPDVMDTIDTGTNRSFADVLQLNEFTNANHLAGSIKSILAYRQGLKSSKSGSIRNSSINYISNSMGLDYATKFKTELYKVIKIAMSTYQAQPIKLLSVKDIALILYITSGQTYSIDSRHINFVKMICGVKADSGSSTFYAYKKLQTSKANSLSMTRAYKLALIIKVWNVYAVDDYPVKQIRVDVDAPLDKITVLSPDHATA